MVRYSILLVAVLALAGLFLPATSVRAGSSAAGEGATIPCRAAVPEGGLVCYPPSSRALAESQLVVPPVDPVRVVGSITGLNLAQLRLFFGEGLDANRGVNLLYGFGSVCWRNEFTCHRRYVVVGEELGPGSFILAHVTRDMARTGTSGSITYGPWRFTGSVPRSNLLVTVYGSIGKAMVRRIGMRLTQSLRRIVLSGSVKGTEHRVLSLPDTGMRWRWKGGGTVQPLGHVTATGTNHAVGFVRTGTPTGVIMLTNPSGTLQLALTYPQTRGFAPLPARATYVITAGTGQYSGATGSGKVLRRLTPCSPALGGASCSAASVRPVVYRFVPAGTK